MSENLNNIFARNHNYSIVAIPGVFKTVLFYCELENGHECDKFSFVKESLTFLKKNHRISIAIEELIASNLNTTIHDKKVIKKISNINLQILKKANIIFNEKYRLEMNFTNHSFRNIFNTESSAITSIKQLPCFLNKDFRQKYFKALSCGYGVKELYARVGQGETSYSIMVNSRIVPTIRKYNDKYFLVLMLQGQINKVGYKDVYEKRIAAMIPKKFINAFLEGQDVKIVTKGSLIWTDLEGSSRLSVLLNDPLEYANIMIRYREAMKDVLFEFGGIFLKSTGDQIIGVMPEHTKNCYGMSLLAGLKMQTRHKKFIKDELKINSNVKLGRNRVVVCTGKFVEIFGGGFDHPEYDINGRIMNKGPRIEHVTPPGEMWIDEETLKVVRGSKCLKNKKIRFLENEMFVGKGIGEIKTYRVCK